MNLYGVHVVLAHNNRATEAVFDELTDAETFAQSRSTDPEVFGAGIARYEVDTPGTRAIVAIYVDGTRQAAADVSDDWRVFASGSGHGLIDMRLRRAHRHDRQEPHRSGYETTPGPHHTRM